MLNGHVHLNCTWEQMRWGEMEVLTMGHHSLLRLTFAGCFIMTPLPWVMVCIRDEHMGRGIFGFLNSHKHLSEESRSRRSHRTCEQNLVLVGLFEDNSTRTVRRGTQLISTKEWSFLSILYWRVKLKNTVAWLFSKVNSWVKIKKGR